MLINLSEKNTLVNRLLAEMRDVNVQNDRLRFRRNLERLGEIMAYEISQKMPYFSKHIETPMGEAIIDVPSEEPVLACILRAGLPLHQGLLNMFDHAESAFISAYRKHHKDGTFEINVEYVSCPSIEGRILIIADPMLATGASVVLSAKKLIEHGMPSQIHIVTAIASIYGVEYVRRMLPNAYIWAGAVDEELTARSYIVPGLGDAGDLAFGEKLQD
jgi:uracil phosphoribosyltransferase